MKNLLQGRLFVALVNARITLAACAACATLATAHAQTLPSGVHVGMSVADVQSASPDLRRVQRPERMSNGARGLWQAHQQGDDGLAFDATYFVRGASVDRIDLVLTAAPEGTSAAYERIVGTLRAQYGAELRSQESMGTAISETASWSSGDEDIAAYMSGPRDAEKIRVVYKRRELKDGATL